MRISILPRQHQSNSRRRRLSFSALFAIALLVLPLVQSTIAQADEALTYDANGNVQTRTLPGGTTTYGYDALDRINNEAGPAKTQGITYDANGNRLSDGTGNKTYTANTDRIVTENGNTISLDAAGQVTQARGLNFVWNQVDGQIKTVSQGGTLLATYFYDYQGHRSRKVTTAAAPQGAGTVIYLYDLYNRLQAEFDGAGNPKLTYVWRDDVPVAIIVHGTTETALYLETDHLGTPIAARDQSAKVVWRWEPDAFGGALPNEDPDGDGKKVTINLRFPGQYYDKESGLHNNWHRYYDPKLGRYMSPDLIGTLGGPNLYAYVDGNPVSKIDPLGLSGVAPGRGPYPSGQGPGTNAATALEAGAAIGIALRAPGLAWKLWKEATTTPKSMDWQQCPGTDKQFGRKYGEHKDEGFGSIDEYRQRANEIYNDPNASRSSLPNGESRIQSGNELLRLDPNGNFRSLYRVQ